MLDAIVKYRRYSFTNGFSGYNQIQNFKPHHWYTIYAINWGISAYIVMPCGLCNALATCQCVILEAFEEYLHKFMELALDDFGVFGDDKKTYWIPPKVF
jgi:hypothetical protein